MQGKLEKRGKYELFETAKGHQILNLNNKEFYAVVEGQKGDILVRSDSDHKRKKTIRKGRFYLADFENDPEFNDIPHLFLQESDTRYREWILPQGVPAGGDRQKKLVRAKSKVGEKKLKSHTERSGTGSKAAGNGKKDLKTKNKDELYELARQANISGRSNMDKQELVKALSSAR